MEFFVSILQDPKTGAVVILGLWCWYLNKRWEEEREDRRKLQEQYNELQERVINGLNTATVAVSGTSATIDALKSSIATVIETLRRDRER